MLQFFTPRNDPVPIVQEAGWAPGPVWTGAENLAPTGIRSLDCPARSSVTIPTELPGPLRIILNTYKVHSVSKKRGILLLKLTVCVPSSRPERLSAVVFRRSVTPRDRHDASPILYQAQRNPNTALSMLQPVLPLRQPCSLYGRRSQTV